VAAGVDFQGSRRVPVKFLIDEDFGSVGIKSMKNCAWVFLLEWRRAHAYAIDFDGGAYSRCAIYRQKRALDTPQGTTRKKTAQTWSFEREALSKPPWRMSPGYLVSHS